MQSSCLLHAFRHKILLLKKSPAADEKLLQLNYERPTICDTAGDMSAQVLWSGSLKSLSAKNSLPKVVALCHLGEAFGVCSATGHRKTRQCFDRACGR